MVNYLIDHLPWFIAGFIIGGIVVRQWTRQEYGRNLTEVILFARKQNR